MNMKETLFANIYVFTQLQAEWDTKSIFPGSNSEFSFI